MKKLRVLTVSFDMPLSGRDIPAFRGAMVEKVGIEHEWFHNHNNDNSEKRYHYRYPLVQYKCHRGKPMIVFLDDCIEEAHKLFSQRDWSFTMKGQPKKIKIDQLRVHEFNMQVWDREFHYYIRNWMPINQKNMDEFMEMEDLGDRIEYLNRKLGNHLVSFCKGINWRWEGRINARITDIERSGIVEMKKIKLLSYSLSFKSNIFLPNYVGIGKSVSKGYGIVMAKYSNKKNKQATEKSLINEG